MNQNFGTMAGSCLEIDEAVGKFSWGQHLRGKAAFHEILRVEHILFYFYAGSAWNAAGTNPGIACSTDEGDVNGGDCFQFLARCSDEFHQHVLKGNRFLAFVPDHDQNREDSVVVRVGFSAKQGLSAISFNVRCCGNGNLFRNYFLRVFSKVFFGDLKFNFLVDRQGHGYTQGK